MRRRRRGFLLVDLVTALAIVGVLGAAVAMSLDHHRSAERTLADSRAALRLAEQALVTMRYDRTPPRSTERASITVRPIPDAPTVGNNVWVIVTVTHADRRAELVGLVPVDVMLKR